jgi:hypothetical protein
MTRPQRYMHTLPSVTAVAVDGVKPFGICRTAAGAREVRD